MKRFDWMPHCSECRRYTAFDQGTFWGSAIDEEPPDAEFFCRKCAEAEFKAAILPGRTRAHLIKCWWMKPTWYRQAHSVLKHREKERGKVLKLGMPVAA